MKNTAASKRGLTLIEVLIALVILSVGVSSMMVAMSKCLSVVRTARSREVARGLMMRVEIENPIESVDLDETTESGGFEDAPGYQWFRDIQVVDAEQRAGLFLVTTRVQWAERGRDAFEEATTFRYAPDAESVTSQVQ